MFLNEMNVQWMFSECSVNVQWMFAEQSRENECSWMIKNVQKIPLTTSHIVYVPNKSHIWYTLTVNIFYIWKPFLIWILITIINMFIFQQ
jgi:hypothetical protein